MYPYQPTACACLRRPFGRLFSWILLAALAVTVRAADTGVLAGPVVNSATGTVTGQVSNAQTNEYLQGAEVRLPALGEQTYTDRYGRFTFPGVPAGDYELIVSYTGLDTQHVRAQVDAGRSTAVNAALTSNVYRLSEFRVTGEREGNAAQITNQRVSPSVRNTVALDAFGNLNNDNAGELLVRLPGVAGRLDDEGNITGAVIRGASPNLTAVSVDGNLQASTGGMNRDFRTHAISGALFDSIQVVKAPTPDMSADGLGGVVNFVTRDPLSLEGGRRISYRAAARWAPPFFDQIPMRRDHPIHPLLSFAYRDVYSVLGGKRNLGIALNAFYSENVAGFYKVNEDYAYATQSPAYVWDYRTQDGYNNRKQTSADLKVEYRLSDSTVVYLNTIYNDAFEPYNRLFQTRAYTNRTVATLGPDGQPTGTGAILPGYTDNVTQVRPVSGSHFQLNSTMYSFLTRERQVDIGARHDWDQWKLEYDFNYNYSHPNLGNGKANGNFSGGIFTEDVGGAGWSFDKSGSDVYPAFHQTAGPSIYDESNYRNGLMVIRRSRRYIDVYTGKVNASYSPISTHGLKFKAGLNHRFEEFSNTNYDRQWRRIGTTPLADPTILTLDEQRNGIRYPFADPAYVAQSILKDPASWSEDLYYAESRRFTQTNKVVEKVDAAYVQGQARFGALDLLTGVREERTHVDGRGFLAARKLSTTAQRASDPIGSAQADYNHPQTIKGAYTNYFPGVYLTYHFNRSLQARFDYSNTIGRPAASELVPSLSASDTAQTVTISNPALKPQSARNFDGDLEYYFEPVGLLSVGWFRKDIKDFIVESEAGVIGSGPDNGFGGDYSGYALLSQFNGGSAVIQGWEFNYQQQFTFLPGIWRGLGAFANYTTLTTHGDYGGTDTLSTDQVAGFVPKTGNVGVSFKVRGFEARVLVNYTGRYLSNYATDPSRLQFRYTRTVTNLNLSYNVKPGLTVFCDVSNLFNEPQQMYRYLPSRMSQTTYNYTTMTFGVSGRF